MASVFKPRGRNVYRIKFVNHLGQVRNVSSGITERRPAETPGNQD